MQRLWAAIALLLAACSASDPPPGPEPEPEPRPVLPGCATDAQCSLGEACRDGACERAGADVLIELPACAEGCPRGQVCAGGVCVGAADAGIERPAEARPSAN